MQRKPVILIAATLAVAILSGGCDKLRARDQLNKGVEAFSSGQFDQAIEHFKSAQQYDPTLTNARLYLAAAYTQQYVPGVPSKENVRNGEEAVKINKDILSGDPNNLSAIDNLGSLLFNMASRPLDPKGMGDAKAFHQKHIELSPNDPSPYYWVGVIDWSLAHNDNVNLRDQYNRSSKKQIRDSDPLPPALLSQFSQKNGQIVDEGMNALNKAIQLNPSYSDAMSYLNLLYRQKADMETSPAARDEDLKAANDLVDKAKAIKQTQQASPNS